MFIEQVTTHPKETSPTFRQGIKDCGPTLLGYVSVGLAVGVVGVSTHLSVMEITLLAALVYAGAAQFAICALLAANSPASAIIITAFIINLRHLLLSAVLAPHFARYSVLKNAGIGLLVTDEIFGVASSRIARGEKVNDRWMNGLNLTAYISWILSCVAGALFGNWITNPEVFGLDFAITAMFLALLIMQLENVGSAKLKQYIRLMIYMVGGVILLSFIVSPHLAVIIATVVVATIGVATDK